MLSLKKHAGLFFPVTLIFLFIFPSCSHFEPIEYSPHSVKAVSEKRSKKLLITGLNLFRERQYSKARDSLEKINYGEKGFLFAVLEIQKINYIEEDWERFFGLAAYYRKKLLSSLKLAKKHFHQEMLALEILALVRHCRLPEALQIIDWSLVLAKNIQKDSTKIYNTAHFFKLQSQIGEKKLQKIEWEKQIDLWPIEFEYINKLENPKNIRMKVSSQC